jgi:hypothetical protein
MRRQSDRKVPRMEFAIREWAGRIRPDLFLNPKIARIESTGQFRQPAPAIVGRQQMVNRPATPDKDGPERSRDGPIRLIYLF